LNNVHKLVLKLFVFNPKSNVLVSKSRELYKIAFLMQSNTESYFGVLRKTDFINEIFQSELILNSESVLPIECLVDEAGSFELKAMVRKH
jgi:hypothetical protein